MPPKRMARTIQRMDVIVQILREENGLRACDIARRMTPDLLGLDLTYGDGEPIPWTPERLSMQSNRLYPQLVALEKDGQVYGARYSPAAQVLWFVSEQALKNMARLDPKLVAQIETIRVEP